LLGGGRKIKTDLVDLRWLERLDGFRCMGADLGLSLGARMSLRGSKWDASGIPSVPSAYLNQVTGEGGREQRDS